MKKEIILTFDLDGTLIDSNNEIIGGDKTISYLKKIQAMGVSLVGNTGRLDHDLTFISDQYDLKIDCRISQNGAVVIDDHIADGKLMDKKEALQVWSFLKNKNSVRSEINTVSNRYWLTPREDFRPKEYYDSHVINENFVDLIKYQPCVLFLCLGPIEDLESIRSFVNTNCEKLSAVLTSNKSLEILQNGVSKGSTLNQLFKDAYTFAIGDSENDHSVFEHADESYYVGEDNVIGLEYTKIDRIDLALEKIYKTLKGMKI